MPLPQPIHDRIQNLLINSPLGSRLGLQLLEAEPDRVLLGLPFQPGNVTVGNVVHGGAIATLIDVSGMAAAVSNAPPESQHRAATASLVVNYLGPANGVEIRAEAQVLKRGKSLVVSRITVRDAAGNLVADGTVTSKLG
ncbi:MAG: PaaI family thioesterase [Ferrovibrio sp.]|nr:PaaI family thioesterase [Ferrovibrio sp.]